MSKKKKSKFFYYYIKDTKLNVTYEYRAKKKWDRVDLIDAINRTDHLESLIHFVREIPTCISVVDFSAYDHPYGMGSGLRIVDEPKVVKSPSLWVGEEPLSGSWEAK